MKESVSERKRTRHFQTKKGVSGAKRRGIAVGRLQPGRSSCKTSVGMLSNSKGGEKKKNTNWPVRAARGVKEKKTCRGEGESKGRTKATTADLKALNSKSLGLLVASNNLKTYVDGRGKLFTLGTKRPSAPPGNGEGRNDTALHKEEK